MNQRIDRVRQTMQAEGLAALLVTSAPNRRYLSGFSGSAGSLLLSQENAVLLTDGRYTVQAAQQAPDWEVQTADAVRPLGQVLAELASQRQLARIGIESEQLALAAYERLVAAFAAQGVAVELLPADGLVEQFREVKDADELALLQQAIAITDAAITAVIRELRPEHTEKQVAWMIEVALRERGADGLSFATIVAAGPNAALPHAQPSDEPLGEGRPIVIDMGGRLHGYHADLTRTVLLGTPDDRFRTVYKAVLEAQQQAIGGLRAGITGRQGDALARDVLAQHGLAEHFTHSLGHGVGLEIHEGPSLRNTVSALLPVGAVVSVEPGVYIKGWGGVRIEDLVLLREDGCTVLSHAPKQQV